MDVDVGDAHPGNGDLAGIFAGQPLGKGSGLVFGNPPVDHRDHAALRELVDDLEPLAFVFEHEGQRGQFRAILAREVGDRVGQVEEIAAIGFDGFANFVYDTVGAGADDALVGRVNRGDVFFEE